MAKTYCLQKVLEAHGLIGILSELKLNYLSKEIGMYLEADEASRKEYRDLLVAVGGLSRLFNDGPIPYLYYRAHESIFCKAFKAKDLSRADVSYDALHGTTGVGLKTFLHHNGNTLQKVAEFNAQSAELRKLDGEELVREVARLRNKRIKATAVQYNTSSSIYHCLTRSEGRFHIYEYPLDCINPDKIRIVTQKSNAIAFRDNLHHYSFNLSKSTLFKRFAFSNLLDQFEVPILDDPYGKILERHEDIAEQIVPRFQKPGSDFIILPLYAPSDPANAPALKSGLNQWNAGGRDRDANEVYIPIPSWIYTKCPHFFKKDNSIEFTLVLPNRKELQASLCQSDSKALMSNPNKDLGRWLLRDILQVPEGEIVTRRHLEECNIDSVIVYKIDQLKYRIDFASLGKFEEFKESFA